MIYLFNKKEKKLHLFLKIKENVILFQFIYKKKVKRLRQKERKIFFLLIKKRNFILNNYFNLLSFKFDVFKTCVQLQFNF